VTKSKPEKALTEKLTKQGGREQQRPDHDAPPGRRPQAPLTGRSTSSVTKDGVPGEGGGDRVRPEPLGPDRAPPRTADGFKSYIPGAGRLRVGSTVQSGPRRRHQAGQRVAAAEHPDRNARHNVELQPGKGGQMARSAGSGIQLVAKDGDHANPAASVGRDAAGADDLPRDGRQVGNLEHGRHHRRQGGSQPLAGQAAHGARLGDEPGRPPARRRRGQVEGRPAPGHPVGKCRRSASAPAPSTSNRTSSSSAAAAAGRRSVSESQLEEGPVRSRSACWRGSSR